MLKNKIINSLFITTLLFLAGCAAGTQHDRKTPFAPESWSSAYQEEIKGLLIFSDPQLQKLLARAMKENFSLKSAALQIERAHAYARIAGADQLPSLSIGVDGERGEVHLSDSQSSTREAHKKYGSRVSLSWEVDIWGRVRDAARAGQLEYKSSFSDYQAARLSLAASIASSWFKSIAAKQKMRDAIDVVSSYTVTFEAVEQRYNAGLVDALDFLMAQTALTDAQANLHFHSQIFDQSIRMLEILVGDYPRGTLSISDNLPTTFASVPLKIPADMVARRPDLISAREKLAAADFRASAATKELLPTLTLSASAGTGTKNFEEILNPNYGLWNLLGGITQPIFEGGRLKAQSDISHIEAEQLWFDYLNSLLTAFKEVEQALNAENFLVKRQQKVEQTFRHAEKAWQLAMGQYRNGTADLLTALVNQRQYLQSRSQVIELRNERVQNQIDLVLALGGSFLNIDQVHTHKKISEQIPGA